MRLGIRSVLPAAVSVISPDETYRRPRCTPGHLSASGKCTVSYHRFHSASTAASTSAVTISTHSGKSDIAFSWRNGRALGEALSARRWSKENADVLRQQHVLVEGEVVAW